jgi:magnesium-transporting ATPase (P-type)
MAHEVLQLLLRGATLRNTNYCIGLVVNTGEDTKFMRNMVASPRKISQLESNMNYLVSTSLNTGRLRVLYLLEACAKLTL